MEGGVTIILTLLMLFGLVVGGVALFGAGGWVRKRQMEGEGEGEDEASRPQHTVVEDDSADVQLPRAPHSRTKAPD